MIAEKERIGSGGLRLSGVVVEECESHLGGRAGRWVVRTVETRARLLGARGAVGRAFLWRVRASNDRCALVELDRSRPRCLCRSVFGPDGCESSCLLAGKVDAWAVFCAAVGQFVGEVAGGFE